MLKEPSALMSNPSYTGATACPDAWRRLTSCDAVPSTRPTFFGSLRAGCCASPAIGMAAAATTANETIWRMVWLPMTGIIEGSMARYGANAPPARRHLPHDSVVFTFRGGTGPGAWDDPQ